MKLTGLLVLRDVVCRRSGENKGSATVLNNVNDRFEKRFSNSIFVQCVDRGVGFFEAWVSVIDGGLNWGCRLSILALTGETEFGSAGTQPHEG